MKIDTSVKIGKLKLKNPVMVASGTFGDEYGELVDINKLGAYVAKTITLEARIGNPAPRVCETPSGMLNSIGLENRGVEYFINEKLPKIKKYETPIIVSIAGNEGAELSSLIRRLEREDLGGYEINLSCPNVKHGHQRGLFAQDSAATKAIIKKIRPLTGRTIIAKLSPNVTDIRIIAQAAESGGADAVLVANTLLGMAVNIKTMRPRLGNIVGGLSGPAIKPIALRMVYETARSVSIPVIGCGGIMNSCDAIEFMIAGASAVQVGTANFVNPSATSEIVDGIKAYMADGKIKTTRDMIGKIKTT